MESSNLTEEYILQTVDKEGEISDTFVWAQKNGWKHDNVVGLVKRIEALSMVETKLIEKKTVDLSDEAKTIVKEGSPEARTYYAVPEGGIQKAELEKSLGEIAKIGFAQAMKAKWIAFDAKSGLVTRKEASIEDATRKQLESLTNGSEHDEAVVTALKKRKLVSPGTIKSFTVTKGSKFALVVKKPEADLTTEMILKGTWKEVEMKEYNFNALGETPAGGYLHPLLKVRSEFRQIFLEMGFEEMPTNNFVESSFWNFDSLFQPQQHPARDAHDTFFLSDPATARVIPEDYMQRVKEMHTNGGQGSHGWRYDWKLEEAQKNILRTHTTSVSSRMLYKLAQEGFTPKKYFSIDRVYRNETSDQTHLAEFHQIEGLIADYNLNLGNLMGIISQFFARLGMTNLRFKPAYNPYTEPSMEVFAFHAGLGSKGKWVEIGNSGVFRPEMLLPMGLPPDVRVIAWGLSLERPTMIKYGISNIRDLVGEKVNMDFVKTNPVCRLDK